MKTLLLCCIVVAQKVGVDLAWNCLALWQKKSDWSQNNLINRSRNRSEHFWLGISAGIIITNEQWNNSVEWRATCSLWFCINIPLFTHYNYRQMFQIEKFEPFPEVSHNLIARITVDMKIAITICCWKKNCIKQD